MESEMFAQEPQVFAQYAGAWATTELVGRQKILQEIHQALEEQGPRVVYITGPGGVGKTFLLREVLRRCREDGEWAHLGLLAMNDVLDFYHTTNHTLEGFTQALYQALPSVDVEYSASLYFEEGSPDEDAAAATKEGAAIGKPAFTRYERIYEKFLKKQYDLAGMLKELSVLRDHMTEVFLDDLNLVAAGRRVVLAFDTAERLLYETDRIQQELDLEPEKVPILDWLLRSFFPHLGNVVVLLAGRRRPEQLREDLQMGLANRLQVHNLEPFSPNDTHHYFDVVAKKIRQAAADVREAGDHLSARQVEAAAERVEAIPETTQEVIWHHTGGRPILLALMVDYLINSDKIHPNVMEPVQTVRQWAEERKKEAQREVVEDLVRFWRETGRVADPVIEALTWARRGLDAELMAYVAGLWKDGQPDIEESKRMLQNVRELSFVKVRSGDERLFLHDEMYSLLDEHWKKYVAKPAQRQIYGDILSYYADKVKENRQRVQELWTPRSEKIPEWDRTPVGQPKPPDRPEELISATATLYHSMAEELYYRLRRDPVDGFQTYQTYAQEAFWATGETLEHLLRSEMLSFLTARKEEHLDGLHRVAIEVDMALRRQARYNRDRREDAAEIARRIGRECHDLLEAAGPMAPIRLKFLEAESLVFLGIDLEDARDHLEGEVIESLRRYAPSSPFEQWQHDVLWAEIHNDLGYLYRTLGWFHQAREKYVTAVEQWRLLEQSEKISLRQLALRAQHANTLNNLAWALAELGSLRQAQTLCGDALEMRQRLGSQAPVAFSLNTLGLILLRDDKPHRARVQCERALGIFRDLDQPRGIGLASIALAEALRRMSDVENLYAPEEIADLLRRATIHATDAVHIFRDVVSEKVRLIEALIERGCVFRFWAWLSPQYERDPEQDPDQETLARLSEQDLRQAMELAGEKLVFRRLDAHVNLAWLYYYLARFDLFAYSMAEEEAREAIASVPEAYQRNEQGGLPNPQDPDLPHRFYWSLLGKAYMVLGQIAIQQLEEGRWQVDPEDTIKKAGYHYTVALAYEELFAHDYRDIRRAMHRIYGRAKRRNQQELQWLYEGMDQAAQEFKLPRPTRLQRELEEQGILLRAALL